ncbi:MAG: ABC transporter permease [Calditrichaeota bacterium]|nr:MAG: ABC transporter permease [Calditrichota bacterium]MBL1206803.1 ABC transporter permease [Calditrichota bacterium]NOG46631.1 ABC transporter permease [Calditrichota bacterium]
MLLILAWKNIWRNKKRSMIIVLAITFGLWGGLFSGAMMMGMAESMVNTAIDRNLAHIQIHHQEFSKERDINAFIPNGAETTSELRKVQNIDAISARVLIDGMAASPASSFGVNIIGINAPDEKEVTDIDENLIDGVFFESDRKNQIIIGKKLAERLNLRLRKKVVLSFPGIDESVVYLACRVVGIFKTESSVFDGMTVFVQQKDLFRSLGSEPLYHEIAIRTTSAGVMQSVVESAKAKYPKQKIQTWKELAPELGYMAEMMDYFTYLFVGIILFALLFGITNTMLMSVLDRVRELGMLIAVGMKKWRVFFMILIETILLSLTGGLSGFLVGATSISYFSFNGMDFSGLATSFESFGMSTMIYPYLPAMMYLGLTIMVIIAANIAALMPALKAIKLEPAVAIRSF